ncbi:hypothetical protein PBT90_14325 [Algoriphagus halophytocola]|uniref:hypothetical protein n=1 Tax=Algoriphagus halophytocola TaxID=2991499 RepID=UPI0022DE8655|nr:hypothetical protein [Algoriphagus sp. TR-M9]WBL41927.1 hypothetical protein PBT90_14325 [Algoriphagus sp. TR-M9]
MKFKFFSIGLLFIIFSCGVKTLKSDENREFEFVKVDSLVTDILETVRILDYHHEKELYLIVKQMSMEGHYMLLDKNGEIVAENKLSEGPDAFGMVLLRAGFVGDEIMFVSDGKAFVYDLDFKQLRKFPFEQNPRVKLVHFSLDNLSTFKSSNGELSAIANLNDGYYQPYPLDYYDTLNMVHLLDVRTGSVSKGGKLNENGKFRSGRFYPFMDKPVYFSDLQSKYISTILRGDTTLYQLDPNQNFKVVNQIQLKRIQPDVIKDIPMEEASFTSVKEYRSENVRLGGAFDEMMGNGDEVLVGYQTGDDLDLAALNAGKKDGEKLIHTKKRFYFLIRNGKLLGKEIEWTLPGSLKLNVGPNRYLQYGDQAELHEFEKDYQCYYIYELREME